MNNEQQVRHNEWLSWRHEQLTAPTGNLSLVLTDWFTPGTTEEEAQQRFVAAQTATADTPTLTVTQLQRTHPDTGENEYGLRVWDAKSPAIRAFKGVDRFPYNPDWVIEGRFTPVSQDRTIPFEHIRDAGGTRDLIVPGDITATIGGAEVTLAAFDDAGTLLLVFGDETGRADDVDRTYMPGRFLFVERDGDTATEGPVRLDFNRAFVPPCGFSAQFNCPMPPPQNRLSVAVRAGEKLPRFTGDFDIASQTPYQMIPTEGTR